MTCQHVETLFQVSSTHLPGLLSSRKPLPNWQVETVTLMPPKPPTAFTALGPRGVFLTDVVD